MGSRKYLDTWRVYKIIPYVVSLLANQSLFPVLFGLAVGRVYKLGHVTRRGLMKNQARQP